MTQHPRPRRRPSLLAALLPALVLVSLVATGTGGLGRAGSAAPVVDLQVTSAVR